MDRKGLIILFLVVTVNPWLWKIIQENFPLAVLLIILSLSLFVAIYSKKSPNWVSVLVFSLVGIISFLIFPTSFDRDIFRSTQQEQLRQDSKHLYYANDLGKIYLNRVGLYFHYYIDLPLYKLQRNFFSNLDLNLYFFASHPRERVEVNEFEKYPFYLLPFFPLGIVAFLQKKLWLGTTYFLVVALISSFIRSDYNFGPVLFFPLLNVIIVLGVILVVQKIGILKLWGMDK